jgi:hypothetical protein
VWYLSFSPNGTFSYVVRAGIFGTGPVLASSGGTWKATVVTSWYAYLYTVDARTHQPLYVHIQSTGQGTADFRFFAPGQPEPRAATHFWKIA